MSKQSAYFNIPDGLNGNHSKDEIKSSVASIRGVISVSVNASANKVAVDYDSTGTSCDAIKDKIEKTGYSAQIINNENHIM